MPGDGVDARFGGRHHPGVRRERLHPLAVALVGTLEPHDQRPVVRDLGQRGSQVLDQHALAERSEQQANRSVRGRASMTAANRG